MILSRGRRSHRGLRISWSFRTLVTVALILALVVEIGLIVIWAVDLQGEMPSIEKERGSKQGSPALNEIPTSATEHHFNEDAGYSFRYPEGWDVHVDDTLSTLRSPDAKTVMLVGVGSPGSIDVVSAEFTASLKKIYSRVRIERQEIATFGDTLAVLVSGNLVNASGKHVRFISATLKRDPRNVQVAAYFDLRENETTIERLITDILESFRVRTSA